MGRRERELIEKKCVELAESDGWIHVKLDVAKKGWPDRLFLGHDRRYLYVEFKWPGESPNKKQRALHRKMAERGFTVHVIDNVTDFRGLLRMA